MMKFLGLIVVVVCLVGITTAFIENVEKTYQCHHFSEKTQSNSPCTHESHFDDNGMCNRTETCDLSHNGNCFVSWTVDDKGEINIIKRGCWIKSDECIQSSTCVSHNNTDNRGVFFCCCNTTLCNDNVVFIAPKVFDEEPELTEDPSFSKDVVTVIVVVIVLLLIVIAGVSFRLYQLKIKRNGDVENSSTMSPQSGTTQVTTDFCGTELTLPELIDLKAQGRFGSVWKATHNGGIVAVKTFEPNNKNSWQTEKDIFNTPLLNTNPNVLRFIGTATQFAGINEEFWLITEFHEHGSLTDYLKAHTVSLETSMKIMETMAHGLSFLHEDVGCFGNSSELYKPAIAHRDFKSKNVLLDRNLNAIIADFGLAVKFEPNESLGDTHGQVGTVRYMAPEVLEGSINFHRDAFLKIDMYAFALVLWEIAMRTEIDEVVEGERYYQPFEQELGTHPGLDVMTLNVAENKLRPKIQPLWRNSGTFGLICDTMDECWDHDAEARLSAGCVEERTRNLIRKINLEAGYIQRPDDHNEDGINDSTERMNQRNREMSNRDEGSIRKVNEEVVHANGSLSSGYHSHALSNTPTHGSLSNENSGDNSNVETDRLINEVSLAENEGGAGQPLLMS